jgi:hypothetical protein
VEILFVGKCWTCGADLEDFRPLCDACKSLGGQQNEKQGQSSKNKRSGSGNTQEVDERE